MRISNLAESADDFTGNVWLMENSENVLIDTGTGDTWKSIRELEELDRVVLTHSHYDHADNLPQIAEKYSPRVYAFNPDNLPVEAEKLEEGDKLDLAGSTFQVFHTPGHKDDSICLYSEEDEILFTGDLVFPEGGFGRTDLEEGDRELLINSIRKLTDLEIEEFYPGHENSVKEDAERQLERSLEEAEKRESKY